MKQYRHIVALAGLSAILAQPAWSQTPAPAPSSNTNVQAPTDYRSTKLVGTTVYNANNENIGEIEDVVISSSGSVSAVVVGVGGFLGMGEKNVAMPFSSIKTSRDENGAVKVVVDGTKDSLKAMPAYTYNKS